MANAQNHRLIKMINAIVNGLAALLMLFLPYADVLYLDAESGIKFAAGGSNYTLIFSAMSHNSLAWVIVFATVVVLAYIAVSAYAKPLSKFVGWASLLSLVGWILCYALIGSGVFNTETVDVTVRPVILIALPFILLGIVLAFVAQFKINPRKKSEDDNGSWAANAAKAAAATNAKKKAEEDAEKAAEKAAKKA